MPKSKIEQEIEAIKAIATALEPLDPNARQRVVDYASGHLGLRRSGETQPPTQPGSEDLDHPSNSDRGGADLKIVDIRSFREEKRPSTDIQMAAIVAYYLAKLAPQEDRKEMVTADDVKKYFDQAGHPLPPRADLTLNNAKTSGYLDSAGRGKFRLNPVGHNLVVHNLPKSDQSSSPRARKRTTKKRRKKNTAKKVTRKKTSKKTR